MVVTREQIGKTTEGMDAVSHILLPYSPDPKEPGVYFLSDLSIGVAWELTPLATSHLSGDKKSRDAERFGKALRSVEDYASLQVLALPTKLIDEDMANYQSQGGTDHPLINQLEQAKVAAFHKGCEGQNINVQDVELRTKKNRIIATLTLRAAESSSSSMAAMWDAIRGGIRKLRGQADDDEDEAADQVDEHGLPALDRYQGALSDLRSLLLTRARYIERAFASIGVTARRLEPNLLGTLYRTMMYMQTGSKNPLSYNPSEPLHTQIPLHEIHYDQTRGTIFADGVYHRVLTVSAYPEETFTGMLSEPNEELNWLSLFDYITDGVVAINVYAKPRAVVEYELEVHKRYANSKGGNPTKQKNFQEDLELADTWVNNKRRMFEVQLSFSMGDTDETRATLRLQALGEKLQALGFDVRFEQAAAPTIWMQQLPFGYKPSLTEAKRNRKLTDAHVADLLPIYLMGRGTKNKTILGYNRMGEPFGWDPHDSNTAYNGGIFAESGSGKSVKANTMFLDVLRIPDAQVFIIDKGRSYVQTTALVGGQFKNITLADKTCMNVFSGAYSTTSGFLKRWLRSLAEGISSDGEPGEPLKQRLVGMMDSILRETFVARQNPPDEPIGYHRIEDLYERFPIGRSMWIDWMRKRITCFMEDEMLLAELETLKEADGDTTVQFEVYYRVYIQAFQDDDRHIHQVETLADLSTDQQEWFASRYRYLEADERGVSVLASSRTAADSLKTQGYTAAVDMKELVVEAAERHDVRKLIEAGMRVKIPDSYRQQERVRIRQEAIERHGTTATAEIIEDYVDNAIQQLDAVAYFDSLEGKAIIQQEVVFSDFADHLQAHIRRSDGDNKEMLTDLYDRLRPYFGKGAHAGFFDGPTQFDLRGNSLVCFECGDLFQAGQELIGAILGAIFHMISIYAASPDGMRRRKMVFIDEYFEFMRAPVVIDFTETILRQGRKHNLGCWLATQSVLDVSVGKAAKLKDQLQFLVIGMQKDEVVAQFDELLKFSPEQCALASSCITIKGSFSEFMFTNTGMGICEVDRLILPPLFYWAFTTAPEDKEQRDRLSKELRLQGMGKIDALVKALQTCAEKWPHGVAAGQAISIA